MNRIDFFILTIVALFILAFLLRNLITYLSVRKSIRGTSIIVSVSILLSMLNYLLILILVLSPVYRKYFFMINLPAGQFLSIVGCIVLVLALAMTLSALYFMRNSWRVGILTDQKTELITSGVYKISRNPYFVSYGLLLVGVFLIYPSVVLLIMAIAQMLSFHRMILDEEKFLQKIHGEVYRKYRQSVSRYLL